MTTGMRTIAYQAPVAACFGDRFEATMINRRVEIGFGSKRFYFTMRSSRFRRSVAPATIGQGGSILWRAMGLIGCASLGLGLVFVSGGVLRASPPVVEYAVVVPIDAKPARVPPRARPKARQFVRVKPVTPRAPVTNAVEDWSVAAPSNTSDAGAGLARPDPDIATLPTVNGERAVAVYGPYRRVGGKSCRDVSLFVRDVDGKVSASPSTQCEGVR
ncbi:MAG: hypothetical protein JSR79_11850 [Proteobacteria bacterium]|nr:hypothetical protein [Pseudomonadota bacterium]